jgi:hypothetical protein
LAVDLTVEPVAVGRSALREGDFARVRFTLTDVHTGAPLSGLFPAAWMDRLETDGPEEPGACRQKVEGFVGGAFLSRPDLDLNTYYVLTLNDDATISVVDPLFGFGNSHLLSMVLLKARGEDWALTPDGRFTFVGNEGAGTVSIVETGKVSVVREVEVGAGSSSLAWSEAAKAVWVASADGTLAEVRPESDKPAAVIHAEPGLGRLRFAPGGRLGFVLDPGRNRVHVLDAASGRIVQTAATEAGPDQVAFSDDLAYIRHRGSPTVLMIPLLYKEGMAAPMGHFQTYGKQPRAVLVVDRSLRETAPGVYETEARLGAAGSYDLALLLDSPRLVHCFPVTVAADPAAARAQPTLAVEYRLDNPALTLRASAIHAGGNR